MGARQVVKPLVLFGLTALPSAMLAWALVPGNPYSFFLLLRVVVCFSAAYEALIAYGLGSQRQVWLLGGIAALYNPFVPVHLTRQVWWPVNLLTIFALGAICWWLMHTNAEPSNHATAPNKLGLNDHFDLEKQGKRSSLIVAAKDIFDKLAESETLVLLLFLGIVFGFIFLRNGPDYFFGDSGGAYWSHMEYCDSHTTHTIKFYDATVSCQEIAAKRKYCKSNLDEDVLIAGRKVPCDELVGQGE